MTAGIYTVAYGTDYDRCAACALYYSRKHTSLPFAVATNLLPEARCKRWADVANVTFVYHERSQGQNRRAKLNMDLLSPFDLTLYIDADSVIQGPGADTFVSLLEATDMAFNWRITFRPGDRIWNLYARTMAQFGVTKPIGIYNGGIIAFKKTPAVRALFAEWLRMWEATGCGREMPALNCAIKKTGIEHSTFPLLFFADAQHHPRAVIQHNFGGQFGAMFGIPRWVDHKPFDGRADDFRLEKSPCQ